MLKLSYLSNDLPERTLTLKTDIFNKKTKIKIKTDENKYELSSKIAFNEPSEMEK